MIFNDFSSNANWFCAVFPHFPIGFLWLFYFNFFFFFSFSHFLCLSLVSNFISFYFLMIHFIFIILFNFPFVFRLFNSIFSFSFRTLFFPDLDYSFLFLSLFVWFKFLNFCLYSLSFSSYFGLFLLFILIMFFSCPFSWPVSGEMSISIYLKNARMNQSAKRLRWTPLEQFVISKGVLGRKRFNGCLMEYLTEID